MDSGLGPENWIGLTVVVSVVGTSGSSHGELVDVGDHGITMRLAMDQDDATGERVEADDPFLIFHPWSMTTFLTVRESDLER